MDCVVCLWVRAAPEQVWDQHYLPGVRQCRCAMSTWSHPFCCELCDCSKPCIHSPCRAAAFQAVVKLVSVLDL